MRSVDVKITVLRYRIPVSSSHHDIIITDGYSQLTIDSDTSVILHISSVFNFYRTMLYVQNAVMPQSAVSTVYETVETADCGITAFCSLSVCPSVTFRYRDHIG